MQTPKRNKKIAYLLTPIAFATAQLFLVTAHAEPTQLPEVEVVANTVLTGVGVPVTEMPSNVQLLKKKDISNQGANNLADLLNNNLGSVSVSNGTGNAYQNDVNYRGFSATSLLGAPVGLSVYLDGVRMNEPFGSNVNWDLIPMNAISSINLLPGSNPMFGLNTLGGALVVNTKNGKDDSGTSISLLGGSFNRKALNFETGWVDDARNADYFISGNYDKQDGYRWYSNSTVQQLYGKARWHDADTKAELSLALADNKLNGTQALPSEMLGTPKAAYTYPDSINNKMALLNLKLSRTLSDGDLLSGNLYYRRSNSSGVNSNARGDDHCTYNGGTTDCVTGKFSTLGTVNPSIGSTNGAKWYGSSATGFTTVGTSSWGGGPTGTPPYYTYTAGADWGNDLNTSMVYSTTRQNTIGTNLMWTNTDDKLFEKNNTFSLGTSLDYSHINFNQNTYLARLVGYQVIANPYNTKYCASGATNCQLSALQDSVSVGSNNKNFSIFLIDTLDVTEKLKVSASGSLNVSLISLSGANNQYLNSDGGYSWHSDAGYTTTSGNFYNPDYVGLVSPTSFVSGTQNYLKTSSGITYTYTPGPENNDLSGNHRYQRFNPALGFSYLPTKSLNIFGGYSEAMRAPTAIELACADPAHPCTLPTGFNGDPHLNAVIAKTYELGARGLFNANAAWNMAIYNSKLSNDIQFVQSTPTTGNFANVGNTERSGLEAGINGKYDDLFVAANYGYVDARYRSSWTTTTDQDVISGNKIPGIASQTLKVRAMYQVTQKFLVGSNLILVSGQYAHGDEGNQYPKVPGYGVMNLDLHYRVSDDLMLNGVVNNLFDKQYYTYGVRGTNIYTGNVGTFVTPAALRSVWLGLTYTFGGKRLNKVDKD